MKQSCAVAWLAEPGGAALRRCSKAGRKGEVKRVETNQASSTRHPQGEGKKIKLFRF